MKKPDTAGFLSFIFPGLGQFYNGQGGKGIIFMIVQIIVIFTYFSGIFTILLYPIVLIWSIMDAINSAEKINREQDTAE